MIKKSVVFWGILGLFLFSPVVLNAHIIMLSPSDFMPQDVEEGSWRIAETNGYLYVQSTGSYRELYCSLPQLPHNGTLDQIRVYYYDNSVGGHLEVTLYRRKLDSQTAEQVATWLSSGYAGGIFNDDIETFTYPTIKSKGYRYYIKVYFSSASADTNIRFYGLRVRYYGGE